MKILNQLRRNADLAALFCALACFAAVPSAHAQANANPPNLMTYQGFLADGNGNALGTNAPRNYDVIFRIWDAQTGGAKLWAEQQTVTVDKGYFSVLLGEGSSIGEPRPLLSTLFTNATASDRWVGITVKGIGSGNSDVDILPRLRLLTSPYSFLATRAVSAASIDGGGVTSGTVADARLSSNVALRSGGNTFSGTQVFNSNVGIGAASPLYPITFPNVMGDKISLWGDANSSYGFGIQAGLLQIHTAGGNDDIGFGYGSSAAMVERMRIKANGNVGIGTTAPASRLHVNGGNMQLSGGDFLMDNSYTFQARNSAGNMELFLWPRWLDNATYLNYGSAGFFIRNNSSTPVMFMQPGGNVGIGTTTPSFPLTVQNNALPGIRVQKSDGRTADFYRNNTQMVLQLNFSHWYNENRWALFDGDNNWDFGSDRKLKKDIVDAEPMLDRAMQLQVRRYRWKNSEADSKHMLGVIAQEVQTLFPDLVGEFEDPQSKERTLTVGYSDFGVIAIKAIQELKKQHDSELADIKAQLAELARENRELRSRLETKTAAAR